jgi:DNA-binding PadR family transcriptional regulator
LQAPWSSEMILLGLLCERPMHGYELSQMVREDPALHVIWRFERSEVYFLLGKLRERGYVVEAKGGGPTRTIYSPTPEGPGCPAQARVCERRKQVTVWHA